jgi:hypothetical protein
MKPAAPQQRTTCVRRCGLPPASIPHARPGKTSFVPCSQSPSRAVRVDSRLPPTGPVNDFHLQSLDHGQHTQSGYDLLPFSPSFFGSCPPAILGLPYSPTSLPSTIMAEEAVISPSIRAEGSLPWDTCRTGGLCGFCPSDGSCRLWPGRWSRNCPPSVRSWSYTSA